MSFSPTNASAPEDERMTRRRTRLLLRAVVVVAGLALICVLVLLRGGSTLRQDNRGKLRILRTFSVPLREISGLGKSGTHIFAVGDGEPLLGVLQFTGDELKLLRTINFTTPLWRNYFLCPRPHNSICRSLAGIIDKQWEGLYYEAATDTLHVLQESTGSIFVFNRTMDRILSRTMLDFFPDRYEKSARTNNSLGEGFVPLADGRILVAKEKFPAAVIEFGAQDNAPQGYDPHRPPHPETYTETVRTLYPRHYWHLPKSANEHCDLSDVVLDDDGALFGISQVCRRIYRFAALNPRTEQLQVTQSWQINSTIKAPEALLVISPHIFLVASDVKNLHHNLWLLATPAYRASATVAQDNDKRQRRHSPRTN